MAARDGARRLERHDGTQEPSAGDKCRFCARAAVDDVVDAGGDVGRAHRVCFVEWDRRQEALEAAATIASFLPDPGELRAELEMEDTVARAA